MVMLSRERSSRWIVSNESGNLGGGTGDLPRLLLLKVPFASEFNPSH
jgi:hypothetical protein